MMLYTNRFPCGHIAKVTASLYHKPACPACMRLAHALVEAQITDPETVSALQTYMYSTPSGKPKALPNTLAHIAKLDPELVPKCALLKGSNWDWARHFLAGTKPERRLTQAALCAKAIKEELAKEFKGVKVRVTTSNYSGGDSVTVRGSFKCEADFNRANSMVDKYQFGHFDGMTDMYEYSNHQPGLAQAKYVFLYWHKED